MEGLFKAFPDLRIEVEQIIASGDSVVTRLRVTGTHEGNFAWIAPTGKSIAMQACSVVEVRNGKAVRGRLYADNASLFQQLGVLVLPKAVSAG